MPVHRLVPADDKSKEPWLLKWDDQHLILKNPLGERVIETATAKAHQVIDLSEVFGEGKIGLVAANGLLRFKQYSAVVSGLRELVNAGLRSDPEYRAAMRRKALWYMPVGAVVFLGATGLFVCFCLYFALTPEPPPDSWIRSFRGVIKWAVGLLIAFVFVGLWMVCVGLRLWWRIRGIERTAAGKSALAEPDDGTGRR